MTIQCISSSSINGSDEMFGCKLLPLSHVCLFKDGALRFRQVECEEETLHNACRFIFIGRSGCIHVSMGVHWALLISIVIAPQMNGRD